MRIGIRDDSAAYGNVDQAIAPEGPRTDLLPGLPNLFLDSVQITVLRAGETINSIPAEASRPWTTSASSRVGYEATGTRRPLNAAT